MSDCRDRRCSCHRRGYAWRGPNGGRARGMMLLPLPFGYRLDSAHLRSDAALCVRLTSLTLSCTAKARVPLRPAARRLPPRRLASARMQFAADVTPCRFCSAEALQRRTEAGP